MTVSLKDPIQCKFTLLMFSYVSLLNKIRPPLSSFACSTFQKMNKAEQNAPNQAFVMSQRAPPIPLPTPYPLSFPLFCLLPNKLKIQQSISFSRNFKPFLQGGFEQKAKIAVFLRAQGNIQRELCICSPVGASQSIKILLFYGFMLCNGSDPFSIKACLL